MKAKALWTKIQERYDAGSHLLIVHGLMAVILYGFYRLRIYWYIRSLYPDIRLNGFTEYLSLSRHYDSAALCLSLALLLLILLLTARHIRIRYAVLTAYSVIFIFFLLFSMDFFRVYETTFQKNYAGKEHFSGLGNVIDSALAEFSAEFLILFSLLTALTITIAIALYRW
jgi:hypothetical protein